MNTIIARYIAIAMASVLFPLTAFAQVGVDVGGPLFDEADSNSYGGGSITLCYHNQTRTASARQAARLIARGATVGPCTPPGTLIVTKITRGGDGTFSFSSQSDPIGNFKISTDGGSGSATFTLSHGSYTIVERDQRNWRQVSNSCTQVVVVSGGTVNCTIVNEASPASISGTVYVDLFGNGLSFRNPFNRRAGVTVYLDTNNNNVLDGGEQSTASNFLGNYTFANLPSTMTYHVREVVPTGFVETYPSGGVYDETPASGQNIIHDDFGNNQPGRAHRWFDRFI